MEAKLTDRIWPNRNLLTTRNPNGTLELKPLVRRAHTNSVSCVILTSVYAFLAGVGFTVLVGTVSHATYSGNLRNGVRRSLHAAVWLCLGQSLTVVTIRDKTELAYRVFSGLAGQPARHSRSGRVLLAASPEPGVER